MSSLEATLRQCEENIAAENYPAVVDSAVGFIQARFNFRQQVPIKVSRGDGELIPVAVPLADALEGARQYADEEADRPKGIDAYEQILSILPDFSPARINLAVVRLKQRQIVEARLLLDGALLFDTYMLSLLDLEIIAETKLAAAGGVPGRFTSEQLSQSVDTLNKLKINLQMDLAMAHILFASLLEYVIRKSYEDRAFPVGVRDVLFSEFHFHMQQFENYYTVLSEASEKLNLGKKMFDKLQLKSLPEARIIIYSGKVIRKVFDDLFAALDEWAKADDERIVQKAVATEELAKDYGVMRSLKKASIAVSLALSTSLVSGMLSELAPAIGAVVKEGGWALLFSAVPAVVGAACGNATDTCCPSNL